MRKLVAYILLALWFIPSFADGIPKASDFKAVCDTLTARCNRRFLVTSKVNLEKVFFDGSALSLYFNRSLADYPWHEEDVLWFLSELNKEGSKVLGSYIVGSCNASGCRIEELVTPRLGKDGKKREYIDAIAAPAQRPFVQRVGARTISRGLFGRHIALWQSHGRYYNEDGDRWIWQRAPLHRTVEDMYTQSYVLQGVIPMLENAGAYVMTPRERDVQTHEVVCDNDPAFPGGGSSSVRTHGQYEEHGQWQTARVPGFADVKQAYEIKDNPFRCGTARFVNCSVTPSSTARWTPDIPERGEYAVYVSYKSLSGSCTKARYTVRHMGGKSEFLVDQRRGGGTWIYLGTFDFAPGTDGWVELDNKGSKGEVVCADAVRFGGGMGKVARGGRVSGMPSFAEGASYWLTWAGVDSTLRQWDTDYTTDYAIRGAWCRMMKNEKGVPFDCSLAFHSDAGTTPNDSIVGTLAIYTLKGDDGRKFSEGGDRLTSRTYCDFVQTQIVEDLRAGFDPKWSRRMLWDRSYNESRTTDVPAMLLELLSHQNFADMKYGLDPSFRYTVSRAVYKGILKYLAYRYKQAYVVQPLPVHAFSVRLAGTGEAVLKWLPTEDALEPTARPRGYTVYTRVDDGAFDEGVSVIGSEALMHLEPGHVYSWKVVAWNDGGCSFPSEVLAAGIPASGYSGDAVLVVNNFDRVAAPAWVDKPDYAGFESRLDPGMPYIRDICFIGENYEFRRGVEWKSDDAPGFGASYSDYAGSLVSGNTFDYPAVHGESLLRLGWAFSSMSCEAFCSDTTLVSAFSGLDLICGAQLSTKSGRGAFPVRFQVFPESLRTALSIWSKAGGNILVSGSRIATDVWSAVYDFVPDALEQEHARAFVQEVLGYKWASSFGTNVGAVGGMPFYNTYNPERYCVMHPDGLNPAGSGASVWLRYDNSGVSAAVRYTSATNKVVSIGVPIECLKSASDRDRIFREAFDYFE